MDDKEIIELYKKGKSLASLSRLSNLSTYKVRQLLVNNNIKIRTQAQQNVFSNQERTKSVDEKYFNIIDTPNKAWMLGFLAADGSVSKDRNRIKIGLSTIDKEILEKIRQEMKIERAILDMETNNGYQVSELSWSSANQKKQLANFGIVPNKTYKVMEVPAFSLVDLKLAFVQGFFDGDGCFKDDGKTCRWEVCSYRPEILQSIANTLNEIFSTNKQPYQDPSRQNYWTLTYSTEDAWNILKKCYNVCPLYLDRKFQKVMNWAKRNQRI